jgi:hypothetical protein
LFWEAYPRKKGKKAAMKAFSRASDKPEISELVSIVEKQAQSEQWKKNNGEFIPHPTTWLNQGNWDDEIDVSLAPRIPHNESPTERTYRLSMEALEAAEREEQREEARRT